MTGRFALTLALVLGMLVAGCAASDEPIVTVPPASVGPQDTVSAAVDQTRGEVERALRDRGLALTDAQVPFRPAEGARLTDAPRAVYQVVLPADPGGGFVVVYELRIRTSPTRRRMSRPNTSRPAPAASNRPSRRPTSSASSEHRDPVLVDPGRGARSAGAGDPGRARDHWSGSRSPPDGRDQADEPVRPQASVASRTGIAVSAAAQWRIGSRFTLSVWVRGKSSAGQTRQPATR